MPLLLNSEPVPDELIEREFHAIKAHHESLGDMSCCGRDGEFRESAKENVIARILISQEAERRFPEIDETIVDAELERLIGEHGGRGAFFSHIGLDDSGEELVRQELRDGARVDRLMTELWADQPEPTEEEERRHYTEKLADFMTEETVRASHLFKRVENVEDRTAIYDQLRALRRRARAGEDFDALALEHTDREDKSVDLGFFKRGEFSAEFDAVIFSLEDGEVGPVFASQWGYHLAKVTGIHPPEPLPFEEVRERIRETLAAEFRRERAKALVAELRERAEIVLE